MKTRLLLSGLVLAGGWQLSAAPLTESTFTEIIKDVNTIAATTKAAAPAKLQALLRAPDLVRTGPQSRAELTAADQTITRVGANTVFAFDTSGRNIDLQQGSLLFHSPQGKGGGTIRSGGAAAAVLGTTIIVAATPDGGFKVIVLEGKGRVTWPGGKSVSLKEGQLVFVLPGKGASQVFDLNLSRLVEGSLLVNGFSHELPSRPRIRQAMERQQDLLTGGRAQDTGLTPENFSAKQPGIPHDGNGALDQNIFGLFGGQRGQQTTPKIIPNPELTGGDFSSDVVTVIGSGTLSGGLDSSVLLPPPPPRNLGPTTTTR